MSSDQSLSHFMWINMRVQSIKSKKQRKEFAAAYSRDSNVIISAEMLQSWITQAEWLEGQNAALGDLSGHTRGVIYYGLTPRPLPRGCDALQFEQPDAAKQACSLQAKYVCHPSGLSPLYLCMGHINRHSESHPQYVKELPVT